MSARGHGARKWAIRAAGIAAAIGIGIARGDGGVDEAHEIRVLSGRPDMVTAGDALIGITATRNAGMSRLRVLLDGTDVTDVFRRSPRDVPRLARSPGRRWRATS